MTIDKAIEWFKNKVDDYLEPEKRRVYTMAIQALRAQQKAEKEGLCALCGYGGKHLDAPPCTTCPAHPKAAENNEPLTPDELREMDGEPVWLPEPHCWVLVTHNPLVPLFTWPDGEQCSAIDWYEQVGPAYRHKPKEGTT